MRVNVNAELFPVWPDVSRLAEIVRPDDLALARLEPVFTRRSQGAFGLDLIFARDGHVAAIPAIRVAHEMLVEPETSALLWPAEIAENLDGETIAGIEGRVVPWLIAQTLARQVNGEIVRRFSGGLSVAEFERARAAGFAGAARYADAAVALAPYAYAQRFASGVNVGIADGAGACGAALLTRIAGSVRADLGDPQLNALAQRWFDRAVYGELHGEAEVGIGTTGGRVEIAFEERPGWRTVRVATPVPTEIFISFDPQDSPPIRSFSVRCKARANPREPALSQPPEPLGGSAGRVLLLLPADSERDALPDSDDVRELGRRLRAEGFAAHVASGVAGIDVAAYDLVHAFTLTRAGEYADLLRRARGSGIPVVARGGFARNAAQSVWGTRLALAILGRYQDEAARAHHLDLLALRRLGDANADPGQTQPFPGYAQDVANALALVDVLMVTGAEEEAFARSEFGYSGPVSHVQAYVRPGPEPAPIDEVVGSSEFLLCHAPIHGISNQSFLIRAARRAGIPVVLAGPVADSLFFGLLREELDGSVILWPDPTNSELSALYRRAKVFADVSWTQPSLHRLAKAAACGCAVLTSNQSFAPNLWPGVRTCDVTDVRSIEAGLRDAWTRGAPRELAGAAGAGSDPGAVLHATVQAYAQAAQAKLPAISGRNKS